MEEYSIKTASDADVIFLSEAIISAEKSNTNKLSLSTLFGIDENQVTKLIISMLEEEIDGCEFSVSSFLIAKKGSIPVAAVGGWIEGFMDESPSNILKSNLIGFTFPKECIKLAHSKSVVINNIKIERKKNSLQIEYVYVKEEFRGIGLVQKLVNAQIVRAQEQYPNLSLVQVQVFGNNIPAIKSYEKMGFKIVKSFRSDNCDVLIYLPDKEKLLMEKKLTWKRR